MTFLSSKKTPHQVGRLLKRSLSPHIMVVFWSFRGLSLPERHMTATRLLADRMEISFTLELDLLAFPFIARERHSRKKAPLRGQQMIGKKMVRGLLAVALTATLFGGTARANVILPTGLAPGSQYEIVFVTSDGTTATSANIATYNNFVTAEANQNSTLYNLGVSWHAVASVVPGPAATSNAPSAGIPIYTARAWVCPFGLNEVTA
ncbi:MAG: hypothetical protein WCJ35_26300, partial [Planctomycetota bacterium]